MSIYEFSVKDKKGELVSISNFKGKVMLIVNTATGCGFTPQYKGIEELYKKYVNNNFVVLDFPCNQFLNQAKGSDEEITTFCSLNYGVTFPQFAKIDVNGENAEPLFEYLKKEKGGVVGKNIKWNFTKFLVDKNGKVVERFAPTVTAEKMENIIKKYL